MSGNSININNFCYNAVVRKKNKTVKRLKITLLGLDIKKNKASMEHHQDQINFFRNNKEIL